MDARRGLLNVGSSIVSRIVLLAAALLVRRLLVQRVGTDANGLNALYASVIGMLEVAELGVGGAIAYSMYRPIAEGDRRKVAALHRLHRRIYRIIGALVLCVGVLVMPLLPALMRDYDTLGIDVNATYLLALAAAALSYAYGARTSLIEAHKNNYVTTAILTACRLARYGLQACAVLAWRSYTAFLACQVAETLMAWGLTELAARRLHPDIIAMREEVDGPTRAEVARNARAMLMHKVGTVLVGSVDGLVISGCVGVAALGRYSNYALVASVAAGAASLFFSPLASVVGHLCAEGDPRRAREHFERLYCLNLALGLTLFLGYFATSDGVVSLFLGPGQAMARPVSFAIALNQFTQCMRSAQLLFRDASGTFYNDRWKPVAEGVANLALSLLLVNVLPEGLRVAGVIVSTIATTLLICDVVEPYVVFRHVFGESPRRFYLRSYSYVVLFTGCLAALALTTRPCDGTIAGIASGALASVAVSALALGLLAAVDGGFRRRLLTLVRAAAAASATALRRTSG